jgi:putative transposase
VITVERKEGVESKKQPKTVVGIDLGLMDYAYLSDGTHVENPRFIERHDGRIVKAQKVVSRRMNGGSNRWRARVTLSRRWDSYTSQKQDWQWKLAHSIVDRFDVIGYERLQVGNMMKNHPPCESNPGRRMVGVHPKADPRRCKGRQPDCRDGP